MLHRIPDPEVVRVPFIDLSYQVMSWLRRSIKLHQSQIFGVLKMRITRAEWGYMKQIILTTEYVVEDGSYLIWQKHRDKTKELDLVRLLELSYFQIEDERDELLQRVRLSCYQDDNAGPVTWRYIRMRGWGEIMTGKERQDTYLIFPPKSHSPGFMVEKNSEFVMGPYQSEAEARDEIVKESRWPQWPTKNIKNDKLGVAIPRESEENGVSTSDVPGNVSGLISQGHKPKENKMATATKSPVVSKPAAKPAAKPTAAPAAKKPATVAKPAAQTTPATAPVTAPAEEAPQTEGQATEKATKVRTSASEDEIEATIAGDLEPRENVGGTDQASLTSKDGRGRPGGRPLGVTTGLPILLAWSYIFQQNEKRDDKWTDEQISDWMKAEFPGRNTPAFDHPASCRRDYNEGRFTKNRQPKLQSKRYNADGSEFVAPPRQFPPKKEAAAAASAQTPAQPAAKPAAKSVAKPAAKPAATQPVVKKATTTVKA